MIIIEVSIDTGIKNKEIMANGTIYKLLFNTYTNLYLRP